MIILNLSLAKLLVIAKLNMAYSSSLKDQQNSGHPYCQCHHFGYRTLCPGTSLYYLVSSIFGLCGIDLSIVSNPTSFLKPALSMAQTTDSNARDKQVSSLPEPSNNATY